DREGRDQGVADDGHQHPRHLRGRGHHHLPGEAQAHRHRRVRGRDRREPRGAFHQPGGENRAGTFVQYGHLWPIGRLKGVARRRDVSARRIVVLPRRFADFDDDRVYLRQHLLIRDGVGVRLDAEGDGAPIGTLDEAGEAVHPRSEEHTSELQSPCNLVCRLLLEKKKLQTVPKVYVSVDCILTDVLVLTDRNVQAQLGTSLYETTGDWVYMQSHAALAPPQVRGPL